MSEMVERTVFERLIDQGRRSRAKESVIASPDCRRLAYVVRASRKEFVVVDGQEEKRYDRIERRSLVFSPDGQRLAYVARMGKRWFVVVDGQEEKEYEWVTELVFSPDSQRLAYRAVADPDGERELVVTDGQEEKEYEFVKVLFFTPDSRLVVEVDSGGWTDVLIVDGQEVNEYEDYGQEEHYNYLPPQVFSPDRQRMAHRVTVEKEDWHVFAVVLSGKRVNSASWTDGQAQKQYEQIKERSLVFSPDSRRLAYVAGGGRDFVVVNGREQKQYDEIEERSLVFSPDSQRVAYVALVFSFAWGLSLISNVGESHMVVIDGKGGSQYGGIVAPPEASGIIFDSLDQLHYIARKGNAFYLVEERLT